MHHHTKSFNATTKSNGCIRYLATEVLTDLLDMTLQALHTCIWQVSQILLCRHLGFVCVCNHLRYLCSTIRQRPDPAVCAVASV